MLSKQIKEESLFRISHEIKNSLAVVKGYMSLLDGTIEKYDKYMPYIKESLDHSIAILDDFKEIGKLNIELEVMDINMLFEDVISNYKLLMKDKVDIIYESNCDEILINGDYKRLKEVFINIIKNSIEALENISNPSIKITVYATNKKVFITCYDNGCGMDEYTLSKIGTPFFTTKKNGTGLGVYLSKEIIAKHNGIITYENNNGTKINIKLDRIMI